MAMALFLAAWSLAETAASVAEQLHAHREPAPERRELEVHDALAGGEQRRQRDARGGLRLIQRIDQGHAARARL